MEMVEYIEQATEILNNRNIGPLGGIIDIPFTEILYHSPELAEYLLNDFEECHTCFKIALSESKHTYNEEDEVRFQFKDLPESEQMGIGYIRKEHIGKFKQFRGNIIRVGGIKITPSVTKWECYSCGNIINLIQTGDKYRTVSSCSCGRKGNFKLLRTKWKDVRHIVVEEYIEDYTDKKNQTTTIKVILEEELAAEKLSKKLQPGKSILLTGNILAKQSKNKDSSAYFNFEIMANHIKVEEISLFNMKIPPKLIPKFKELKQEKDIIKEISLSFFDQIEGHDFVKEILTVARARGVKTYYSNGKLDQRGTINVMLIGSAGCSKSELGKRSMMIDPIRIMVSGKAVSGVGMTGTTIFDKDLGSWTVEPGVMCRAHLGNLFLDEADKVEDKDTAALNEAMTDLQFTIAKANQNVTLQSDASLTIALNPKDRTWLRGEPYYKQIPLKADFLDRFDIWVAMEKEGAKDSRKKVIKKIAERFKNKNKKKAKYSLDFIQKYYAWIIQNFKPEIKDELIEYITEEIDNFMCHADRVKEDNNITQEISYRLVGNIMRFSIAIAKINQRDEVERQDIDRAIFYQKAGFKSLDMIDELGNVSVEKVQFETPALEKRKKYNLMDLIVKLYDEKKEPLTYEEIMTAWEQLGNKSSEREMDELLDKLNQRGDITSPRPNTYRPM